MGKTRMRLASALVAAGLLTLILPIIQMRVSMFGKVEWSAFDVVSRLVSGGDQQKDKPSFIDIAKAAKRVKTEVDRTSSPSSTSSNGVPRLPLGIMLAPFIPLEIAITYALLLVAIVVLCVRRMQRALGFISAAGAVTSTVALLSVFLFSNAIQQSLAKELTKPDMRENIFAQLSQAFMESIHVDPGVALYLLVAVMVGLFATWKWDQLDPIALPRADALGSRGSE
ncbi:MAG: hypothetical protein M3P27_01270 [Acidobacteriota bacterium]|nr:hypothetical protein [Acidobacteriota bacterium]